MATTGFPLPVTLYYGTGTCSLSPRIAMNELKLDYSEVKVDLKTRVTEDGRDYTKVSPTGSVPMLEFADGAQLVEGVAIVQWVADQKPEAGLSPAKGSAAHYQFLADLNTIATEIHKAYGALFNDCGPYRALAASRVLKTYARFDERLAKQDYISGPDFTVADGYLFVMARYTVASWKQGGGSVKDVDVSELKNLEAWFKRVAARPAVQLALKQEGLE